MGKIKCFFGWHNVKVVEVGKENLYCCKNCPSIEMIVDSPVGGLAIVKLTKEQNEKIRKIASTLSNYGSQD